MRSVVVFLVALAFSAMASAAGLPFAVESLAKAKEIASADGGKHLLIFYTSPY
jgi:hypothetical protein